MLLKFEGPICLKGERTISPVKVFSPKYEFPILAEINKKMLTETIETKIKIQASRLKSFNRFQVGETSDGYLENQWRGV